MMKITRLVVLVAMVGAGLSTTDASAQVFGTFSWRMAPYCNIVTLTITQFPGGYTLDGNDNLCGAGKLDSATGQALINPDGTVGIDFTIVTSPAGKGVHVAALISPANGSGTWSDSVGNSGTFLLGAAGAGSPRPFPASGIGAGVITTTEIAAGAVRAGNINTAEVQARVTGACPAGQAVSGVNANGTVVCQSTQDQAGGLKRVTPGFVSIPTTAVSFATATNMATLTFTSPVAGTALVVGRGYCNITTATAGGGNLVLGTALTGETTTNSFSDWVALRLPVTAAANATQVAYFAEREVTVVAGVAQTVTLKAFREVASTESMNCRGSYRVSLYPNTLP